MTTGKTLLFLGGAGLLWYAARQYRLYQGIQFGVAGLSFRMNPLELNVRVSIDNPTGVSSTLESITGSIYQGSLYVAQVSYNTSTVIAPYNRTLITLNITPDPLGALQALLQYKQPFQFAGNAVVNGIPLPLRLEYSFSQFINS
jgi:hypothetical protein